MGWTSPGFVLTDFEEVPCADPTAGASCNAGRYGFDPFEFGNSGRNILDGPGLVTVGPGLRKNFRFRGRGNVQLRLDAFNVLNRTNLRLPDRFVNRITGGHITRLGSPGREGGPRVFQAALALRFQAGAAYWRDTTFARPALPAAS